ncbi:MULTISPECIES: GNAT family N-acetyltransferase [Fusobacterium]|uniref:GNAT family N-acetyltransferase n=1 Tax=Fusobacterium TaxID=848 RepID=UPI001030462D|nr:GNAT family N-acetyltransferase [Fusobacterium ulcerans]
MEFSIKRFDELSARELYEIGKIRQEVFVVEQNCSYLDFDEKDFDSLHIYSRDKDTGKIICYARVLAKGLSYDTVSIGRVMVLNSYRKYGYARKLVLQCIECVKNIFGENEITIGAQFYLKDFYSSVGFTAVSDVYDEDGIPHIDMYMQLS